jgi:Protein of unknown function (DUF2842)
MRKQPTLRIPLGILAMLLGLTVYGLLIARFVSPLIENWHGLAQLPVYIALGLLWLVPMKPYLMWMETGRWR